MAIGAGTKGKQLRARGFITAGEAEQHLNEAMSDVQAVNRGEYRGKPTLLNPPPCHKFGSRKAERLSIGP